jgi:hypothetical protein
VDDSERSTASRLQGRLVLGVSVLAVAATVLLAWRARAARINVTEMPAPDAGVGLVGAPVDETT